MALSLFQNLRMLAITVYERQLFNNNIRLSVKIRANER